MVGSGHLSCWGPATCVYSVVAARAPAECWEGACAQGYGSLLPQLRPHSQAVLWGTGALCARAGTLPICHWLSATRGRSLGEGRGKRFYGNHTQLELRSWCAGGSLTEPALGLRSQLPYLFVVVSLLPYNGAFGCFYKIFSYLRASR